LYRTNISLLKVRKVRTCTCTDREDYKGAAVDGLESATARTRVTEGT